MPKAQAVKVSRIQSGDDSLTVSLKFDPNRLGKEKSAKVYVALGRLLFEIMDPPELEELRRQLTEHKRRLAKVKK